MRVILAFAALLALTGVARAEVVEFSCAEARMIVLGNEAGVLSVFDNDVPAESFGEMRVDFDRGVLFDGTRELNMTTTETVIATTIGDEGDGPSAHRGAIFLDRRTGVLTTVFHADDGGMLIYGMMTMQCRTADGATQF